MINNNLVIKVVESHEEQLKAFLVRGIVYMHEQKCPFDEEFDRNDFTASQIIGLINSEPVLTARVRYFGDFAKLERLAVREEYRSLGHGHRLLTFLLKLCRQKGYRKIYLHAQSRLESFYEEYGFIKIGHDFGFSEYEYIEMFAYLDPMEDRLKMTSGPMVLNRPEMNWHHPGPLEALSKSTQGVEEFIK